MKNIIIEAIENKKLIEFSYKGDLRIVEPFVIGVSAKGNDSLRAFQIDGDSTDSSSFGWKLFTVEKLTNLKVQDKNFEGAREYYNPNDSALNPIYARV